MTADEYREQAANLRESARYWNKRAAETFALQESANHKLRARDLERMALRCLEQAADLECNVNQS